MQNWCGIINVCLGFKNKMASIEKFDLLNIEIIRCSNKRTLHRPKY